ncbi:hypothetical protein FKM82_017626 [Ascaphus truei]
MYCKKLLKKSMSSLLSAIISCTSPNFCSSILIILRCKSLVLLDFLATGSAAATHTGTTSSSTKDISTKMSSCVLVSSRFDSVLAGSICSFRNIILAK